MKFKIYEEYDDDDFTSKVGDELLENNLNKKMENGIGTTNVTAFKGALIQSLIVGIAAGIGYFLKVGDIFAIDFHSLVNVMALAIGAFLVPLLMSLLTTHQGNFMGSVKVVE